MAEGADPHESGRAGRRGTQKLRAELLNGRVRSGPVNQSVGPRHDVAGLRD